MLLLVEVMTRRSDSKQSQTLELSRCFEPDRNPSRIKHFTLRLMIRAFGTVYTVMIARIDTRRSWENDTLESKPYELRIQN